jgi:capsular polysaccharide export protein
MSQSFLFLQGPHGPFFRELGRRLVAAGHRVARVNFNGGDVADWPMGDVFFFRDRPEAWPERVGALAGARGVTDLVLYGDCRPLHRTAIEALRPRGVRIHVFEEGYFRPDWITLERDGVNGHSRLILEPAALKAAFDPSVPVAPALAPLPPATPAMVRLCIRHYLARGCLAPLFAHHRSHRPQSSWRELRAWLDCYRRRRFGTDGERRRIDAILADPAPMFLFTLQLDSDAQIRCHSPFSGMLEAIAVVIRSFAVGADPTDRLVIKNHPLDNGSVDYRRLIADLAAACGCADRVLFIEGGHLPTLLRCARGVVMVNSTAGLQAIHHGRPTKVLGRAIYALPGLVDQQPLDTYWRDPEPPDPLLYRALRRHLMTVCQFNGSFFTADGRARLLPAVTARLTAVPAARAAAVRPSACLPGTIGEPASGWPQPWPVAA